MDMGGGERGAHAPLGIVGACLWWSPAQGNATGRAISGLALARDHVAWGGMTEPKLLAQLRRAIRVRHYSRHTEDAYVGWVRRFVRFCGLRHPSELGEQEVARFLSDLA